MASRGWYIEGAKRLSHRPMELSGPENGEVIVRIEAATICGSDIHYYRHGRSGPFQIRQPFILGHEGAGTVVDAGRSELRVGQRVAINPGLQCNRCEMCRRGRGNLCEKMRYFGSAGVDPPSDGLFCDERVLSVRQLHPVTEDVNFIATSLSEPTAIALHAIARGGLLSSRSVAIVGAGPVGLLVLILAKARGAKPIVVIEPNEYRLGIARRLGAQGVSRLVTEEGLPVSAFDVVFEASGTVGGLNSALAAAAKGAVVVQIGNVGNATDGVDLGQILTKELDIRGAFRFSGEFDEAVDAVSHGLIPAEILVTHRFDFDDLPAAFEATGDPSALKVALVRRR